MGVGVLSFTILLLLFLKSARMSESNVRALAHQLLKEVAQVSLKCNRGGKIPLEYQLSTNACIMCLTCGKLHP